MPVAPPINFQKWLTENGDLLKPPVNNYCLYSSQDYTVMVVGGPNERNDYHFNETEEWFFQQKGPMVLKIVDDDGQFKDIEIGEGCMFMLPPNTPHNPCRFADTIGLVVERKRPKESVDRLRWYCRSGQHGEPTVIHEEAFHCEDLGTQLKPLIQRWQGDEALRKCQLCGWVAPPK